MASLYVAEFDRLASAASTVLDAPVFPYPPLAEQKVTFTGTAGASAAFSTATRFIQISSDGICSVAVGDNPTATTSNTRLVAGQLICIGVKPGDKISAVTNT